VEDNIFCDFKIRPSIENSSAGNIQTRPDLFLDGKYLFEINICWAEYLFKITNQLANHELEIW
jgi:hypothetical protein